MSDAPGSSPGGQSAGLCQPHRSSAWSDQSPCSDSRPLLRLPVTRSVCIWARGSAVVVPAKLGLRVASQIRCKRLRVKAPLACYAAALTSSSAWSVSLVSADS
jgi:hypothetical protein